MTSQARIDANRKNAQKSTGPKSAEGKKRSCLNALVHGFRSEQVVLPTEDPSAFDAHFKEFVQEWQPVTKTRMHLVKRIAVATWRLDRCVRVESGRLSKRAVAAMHQWDAISAATLKRSVDKWDSDPERAIRELKSSREGVAKLVEMWRELEAAAQLEGGWNDVEDHHKRLFYLAGLDPMAGGEASDKLLRFLLVARPDLVEEADLEPFGIEEARIVREQLLGTISTRIDALVDLWDTLPDMSEARARHAELEAFVPQPEDAALLRYEAQFDREFRASVNQLARLTKTGDDLIEASDLMAVESEIPTIIEDESPAPNEPKPEADVPPASSEAPNEPNTVTPIMPVPQPGRDRDGRVWGAVIAPEGSDLPQSVGWNR